MVGECADESNCLEYILTTIESKLDYSIDFELLAPAHLHYPPTPQHNRPSNVLSL